MRASLLSRFFPPCLALALLATILPARADGLPPGVMRALKAAQIPASHVAVVVQPVDAAAPLVAHNASQALNPASVMKLVTTYAALDLLGPAYTWKTTLWTEAAPVEGVLNGNVYLRGSGDPRFAIEHLWSLLRQMQVRGIRQINGDVVLDRSAFNVPAIDPGAFDDKPMRPYNVGPDGLLLNFRALRFTLLPDNGKPRVLQETPSEGLRIDNQLKSSAADCSSNWKDFIQTRLIPDNGGSRLEFTGTYAALCGEKTLNLAPLPADAQASGLIRALWKELGGSLGGQVRGGNVPVGARLLTQHESAPLADAVRDINKFSNNVMARQLFLSLDAARPATATGAQRRIAGWLAEKGLRLPGLVLDNGAGLSRSERIDARGLGEVLLAAWRSPVMPELMASLPVAGVDGTMQKRLGDSPANGRAHVKTGYLEGVRAIAGYVLDAGGRRWVVVCLINGPRAREGKPAMDALLRWVAGLRPAADDAR